MTTVRIDILNPKATKLLKELASLNLIAIREVEKIPDIPEKHKAIVRQRIKHTKPGELLDWEIAKKKLKIG